MTSFTLQVECYASLVAILTARYPEKTPHFMAYLRTITRASRNFEGAAWVLYDMEFRRQAANHRSLDWGVIDTALYNEAFTGRARLIPRCRFCLADSHDSRVYFWTGGEIPTSPGLLTPLHTACNVTTQCSAQHRL